MIVLRLIRRLAWGLVLLPLLLVACTRLGGNRADLPWTPLRLDAPVGAFTGARLAALADDPAQCRTLLEQAGVRFTPLPLREDGERCGYADAVRFGRGGARRLGLVPDAPPLACPLAAMLAVWEWQVVQPAAVRHFGRPATRIDHLGSYACRRVYGRDAGSWSEHSRAAALDVAGFRVGDATISVAAHWRDPGPRGAFLREVRDGGCRLFGTVLSPDYNAAHADHLHLDSARRGLGGFCS